MKIPDICPVCLRAMVPGKSIDKHHFVPKCRGGKETEYVHRVCHKKIHSIWSEKELEREFNDPEKVRSHPEMIKFIQWLANKEPDFYIRSENMNRKRRA